MTARRLTAMVALVALIASACTGGTELAAPEADTDGQTASATIEKGQSSGDGEDANSASDRTETAQAVAVTTADGRDAQGADDEDQQTDNADRAPGKVERYKKPTTTERSGQAAAPRDPEPSNPEPSDPEPSDPEPSDPEPRDPEPRDPEPRDPEPNDPEPSDPEPSDPEPRDPEPDDPPGAQPAASVTPKQTKPIAKQPEIPKTPNQNEQAAMSNGQGDESTAQLANNATKEELNDVDRAMIAATSCGDLAGEIGSAYQEVLDQLGDAGRDDHLAVDRGYEAFGAGGRLIQDRANELGCSPDELTSAICQATGGLTSSGEAGGDLLANLVSGC